MCIAMRGGGGGGVHSVKYICTNKSVDTGKQTFDTLLSVKITYSKKYLHLIIDSGVGLPN